METAIVKMSSKGQLVVPQSIREELGLQPTDRFLSFPVKDGILFKKLSLPDAQAEFDALAKDIQKQFREQGVTRKDAQEALKWARNN